MTNKETLLELADRVEALDGPCREMDLEIARTVINPQIVNGSTAHERYTTSLDASMTLVPEGCDFLVNSRGNFARVWDEKESGSHGSWTGQAKKTTVAALTAAALRAIASQD